MEGKAAEVIARGKELETTKVVFKGGQHNIFWLCYEMRYDGRQIRLFERFNDTVAKFLTDRRHLKVHRYLDEVVIEAEGNTPEQRIERAGFAREKNGLAPLYSAEDLVQAGFQRVDMDI